MQQLNQHFSLNQKFSCLFCGYQECERWSIIKKPQLGDKFFSTESLKFLSEFFELKDLKALGEVNRLLNQSLCINKTLHRFIAPSSSLLVSCHAKNALGELRHSQEDPMTKEKLKKIENLQKLFHIKINFQSNIFHFKINYDTDMVHIYHQQNVQTLCSLIRELLPQIGQPRPWNSTFDHTGTIEAGFKRSKFDYLLPILEQYVLITHLFEHSKESLNSCLQELEKEADNDGFNLKDFPNLHSITLEGGSWTERMHLRSLVVPGYFGLRKPNVKKSSSISLYLRDE